jgi:hypothetical protein
MIVTPLEGLERPLPLWGLLEGIAPRRLVRVDGLDSRAGWEGVGPGGPLEDGSGHRLTVKSFGAHWRPSLPILSGAA